VSLCLPPRAIVVAAAEKIKDKAFSKLTLNQSPFSKYFALDLKQKLNFTKSLYYS